MPTPTTGGAAQDPHGEHGRRGKGNSTGGQEGTTWGEVQPCPGGGLNGQPTPHPHLLTPLLGKGLLSLPEPWWDCRTVLSRASSLLPLQRPRQVGRASQAGRGERSFLPSLPSFRRPCPWTWTESGAWSPAAQLLRPRAQRLGGAAPPAHRTWARKGEWPVGVPRGWRPQSLSVTHSMTRCPPAGVRAERLQRPRPALASARLTPRPLGARGAPP